MTMKVIGIKRANGSYEGRDYDNTILYGIVENSSNASIIAGAEVEQCKFKTSVFTESLNRVIKDLKLADFKDVNGLIGMRVQPIYNKYGGCDDFLAFKP